MSNMKFNYDSARSEKARIGIKFSKIHIILLVVTTFLLLIFGAFLLIIGLAFGWALIGISVMPAMVVEWYNGELHYQPIVQEPKTIDDVLSNDILGMLSRNPTPLEIARIVGNVSGGQFFVVRFGISNNFLQDFASDNKNDMKKVWQEAWNIRSQTNSANISAAILTVALIRCASNYRTLLNHLQLNADDLIYGIKWYDYLVSIINKHPSEVTGVNPTSRTEMIIAIQNQAMMLELQNDVTFMYQSLTESCKLSNQYIHKTTTVDEVLNLMELATHYSENGLVTAESVRRIRHTPVSV